MTEAFFGNVVFPLIITHLMCIALGAFLVFQLSSNDHSKPNRKIIKDNRIETKKKFCYVGAPAIFALETACRQINESFDSFGCYLVGSSLERPDWRDIDVRMILPDKEFEILFPNAKGDGNWEFDSRWLLLTVSISERLSKLTGLPIDFQFQPQTHANKRHRGPRHALGIRIKKDKE